MNDSFLRVQWSQWRSPPSERIAHDIFPCHIRSLPPWSLNLVLAYCDRWLSGPTRKSADAQFSDTFGHTGHTISDSVTAVRLKVANSVPNVTEAGGYDVRYGPGHRPRVITKAVGDR